ncbi:MAG TPA: Mut7-C RNAse domain-containing protein, partial [Nitrososphaera sp.]|nr:Mut7-C RNAse domain-containing protein [Nitrososphaera sp.]
MPKEPSFIADAMLGSVARKLRIFGFDTIYIAHARDDEILKTGVEQGRVILTADKELFKRVVKAGARGVLVSGGSDLDDLVHILSKNGVTSVDLDGIGSRCSVCNGLGEEWGPEQVKDGVPDKVAEMHSEFYQCAACGKV